jgi:hypothetical protein
MFLGRNVYFSLGDMIVPQGKKRLKWLPKATQVPSPWGHDFSPGEKGVKLLLGAI